MLVMSIMLSIPLFDLNTYTDEFTSYESGLRTIYMWSNNVNSSAYIISLNTYISQNTVEIDEFIKIIFLISTNRVIHKGTP